MRLGAANQAFQRQQQRLEANPELLAEVEAAMEGDPDEASAPRQPGTQGRAEPGGNAVEASPLGRAHPLHGVWVSSRFDTFSGMVIFDYVTLFPSGVIYDGIAPGWDQLRLDRQALPDEPKELGRFTFDGQKKLSIRWEDGEAEPAKLLSDEALTFTDRGTYRSYLKVQPVAQGTRWDLTFSRSGVVKQMVAGGVSGSFGSAITFEPDGTYKLENFTSMSHDGVVVGDQRRAGVGTWSKGEGRYEFDGYRMTLHDRGGAKRNVSCFVIDWDDEQPGPNMLYIEGVGRFTR
jgi:hypothetical protein